MKVSEIKSIRIERAVIERYLVVQSGSVMRGIGNWLFLGKERHWVKIECLTWMGQEGIR
jgi:hypothetical protein